MNTISTDAALELSITLFLEIGGCSLKAEPDKEMEIHTRLAALNDALYIARIILAASELEPAFRYKYPQWKKYPNDSLECTVSMLQMYINNTDPLWKWLVMVAETPLDDGSMKIISAAVWEVSVFGNHMRSQLASLSGTNTESISERRDANPLHVKAWKETLDNARRQYLEPNGPVDGPLSYLHLQHLFTTPAYQYNGAATALTKWGIKKAEEHSLAIGLFSSPMGELFLRELGFQRVTKVIVQADGETEKVIVSCMKLPVKG